VRTATALRVAHRRRTCLSEYAAALPFWPQREGIPGAEFESAELLVSQERPGERIVLALDDQAQAQTPRVCGRDNGPRSESRGAKDGTSSVCSIIGTRIKFYTRRRRQ
jgi:hypothetical protein